MDPWASGDRMRPGGERGGRFVARVVVTLLIALGIILFWQYSHVRHPVPATNSGPPVVTTAP